MNQVGLHNPVEILKEAGRIVRMEILASPDVYSSWPPTGQELLTKKFEVPFSTETLLLSILTTSNKKTDRISRIVNSLAQDPIYNASVVKKRVLKLGLTVKRKTGSVGTIRWLNRFGHSIPYDEINATETGLAEEQLHSENDMCQTTSNLACLSHSFMIIMIKMLSLYTMSLYTKPME